MTSPLQIISTSETERTILYQTYMRETVVIVQQGWERMPSPFNDLAHRPSDQEYCDWTTQSHMMLPNYLLNQITLLRQSRKSFLTAPQRPNPILLWTRLTSTTPNISNSHLEKSFFATIARRFTCTKTRKVVLGTWQSVHLTGTSSQRRQSLLLRTQLQT